MSATKLARLAELEDALRDDADVIRARPGGGVVRLNLDDAADAVAELRGILGARAAAASGGQAYCTAERHTAECRHLHDRAGDSEEESVGVAVRACMDTHRRHPQQQDVWLPMIRCMCGAVMMSNRYREHLATEITEAVLGAIGDAAS